MRYASVRHYGAAFGLLLIAANAGALRAESTVTTRDAAAPQACASAEASSDAAPATRGLRAGRKLALSLAPSRGRVSGDDADGATRYRVAVVATPGRSVVLEAADVPPGWVASFCSERLCTPNRTTVIVPRSGVKLLELTLVPPAPGSSVPKVRITARDEDGTGTTST